MNQTEEDGIYEVDRIIGRRISLAKKTEYMVFWKGYDISECSWESSCDMDCDDVVADFERRCVEMRRARLKDPHTVPQIDRYDNDGIATLIDEALALIPPDRSPFQDIVDFTFSAKPDESLRDMERSVAVVTGNKLAATHGWNRKVDRSSKSCCRIQHIRGSIRDAAGRSFFLAQWSDKVLTWESPSAYSYDIGVLERHETGRFLKGRKELVQQYRAMKTRKGESIVSPWKPKFLMEKKPDGASRNNAPGFIVDQVVSAGTLSAGGPSITLSDLKTSNLLANQIEIPATPVSQSPRSRPHQVIVSSDEEYASDASMESIDEPFIYIQHVSGSAIRRYRQIQAAKRKLARSKPFESGDGEIVEEAVLQGGRVGVFASGKVAGLSRRYAPSTSSTSSKSASRMFDVQKSSEPAAPDTCAACEMHISSRRNSGAGECTHCNLVYHPHCYDKLTACTDVDSGYADSSSWLGGEFTCLYCAIYMGRNVDVYLTWRVNKAASSDMWPSPLGSVDVLVKWSGFSYRHLDWVPFTWLKRTRRGNSVRLRNILYGIQSGQDPWKLEDQYNNSYIEPDCIIEVKPAPVWLSEKRTRQLEEAALKIERGVWELYTKCESVRTSWKGLEISEMSWEIPPNPADDADDYMVWYAVYLNWKRASVVSLLTHMRVEKRRKMDAQADTDAEQRLDVSGQPKFLRGGQLMDHQIAGANWLLDRWRQRKHAILADEMGMGKTIQIIAFLLAIYHSTIPSELSGARETASNAGTFPFLVIVPTTLVSNWMIEFRKWAPELVVAHLSGRSADREIQLRHTIFRSDDMNRKDLCCHVVLTSYEAATNSAGISALMSRHFVWQAVIVDEGQRLKNDRTKTYAALSRFNARQRIVLTGTPLQNDVRELFSIMSYLDPAKFGSADALQGRLSVDTAEGIEQIKDLVRPYILRRTKDDQLALVPPKYELILPVSMSRLQRELYRATLSRNAGLLCNIATALHSNSVAACDIDVLASANGAPADSEAESLGRGKRGQGIPRPTKPARGAARVSSLTNILMEVRRIVSHPYLLRNVEPDFPTEEEKHRRLIDSSGKLQLLHELLPALRARGHRVLLFSQFKGTLTILEDYMAAENIGYERIDGGTPPVERQTRVNAFNAPDSTSLVFMATTRTGGLGLNLTSADVVIVFDCDFNPHVDLQAMARAHRIGQTKPITVLKLVVNDSAEERIVKVATRKLVLDHLIIQNIGNDNTSSDELLQPTFAEMALRHGASKLFEPNADEDAESRAIRYDQTRITNLLDKCESELNAEEERIKQDTVRMAASAKNFANSTVTKFSRVWMLDSTGTQIKELSGESAEPPDASKDIWSQLLDTTTSSAQTAEEIASEEIGGRHLRVRKRKVDYAINKDKNDGVARKLQKVLQSNSEAPEDGEFVLDSAPESDDDISVISDVSVVNKKPVLDPLVQVTLTELTKIVELHCERLARFYIAESRNLKPVDSLQNAAIEDAFKHAAKIVPDPSKQQYMDPELFFPIPSNMRLRKGILPPNQGTSKTCWACARRQHLRDFCPRICDPAFVALIRQVKEIPGSWRHQLYYRFIHWYTYQYVWFMLSSPKGISVCERNRARCREYSINVNIYLNKIRNKQTSAAVQVAPLTPPQLAACAPSPYFIELPRDMLKMRGMHTRLSKSVDSKTVDSFFSSMASTYPRYANLNKAAFDFENLRANHRNLITLRANTIKGARAKLGDWLKHSESTDLTKVSQLLLGIRCIVSNSADVKKALVGKLILNKAPSLAKYEADTLIFSLLGKNTALVPKIVHDNIVKSRHLLLLLLHIKTSTAGGLSQSTDDIRAVAMLLDLTRQLLVTVMGELGHPTSAGGIGSSISSLYKIVISEKKRRESQQSSSTADSGDELSSSETASRLRYKESFTQLIKILYARLKDVLGRVDKNHVRIQAPAVDGSSIQHLQPTFTSSSTAVVNSATAQVPPLPVQHSQSQTSALHRSATVTTALVSTSGSTSITGEMPALPGPLSVDVTSVSTSGSTAVVSSVTTQNPPPLSLQHTRDLAAQLLTRLMPKPAKRPSDVSPAPLTAEPNRLLQSSATQNVGPSYQQPAIPAANRLPRQQMSAPILPTTSCAPNHNDLQIPISSPMTDAVSLVSAPPTAPVIPSQQFRVVSGEASSIQTRTPSPGVSSAVRNYYSSARSGSLTAAEFITPTNVVAKQLGLSQMSPTNQQQPTFGTGPGNSSGSSRAVTTLANAIPLNEMGEWRDRMLSPGGTATQQTQNVLPQLNRQHHRVIHPQQQYYYQQQQMFQQFQTQQISPADSNVYSQLHAMQQHQQQQYRAQQLAYAHQLQQQGQQIDQQQLRLLELQFQQYFQQPGQHPAMPYTSTVASGSSSVLIPTKTAMPQVMVTPQTPALQTSLMTPMSNSSSLGGNGSNSWDLACALCGELLHTPSSCANRTDISKLTRRRVEVEMNTNLGLTIKEMMLDTIDKYLKAAYAS